MLTERKLQGPAIPPSKLDSKTGVGNALESMRRGPNHVKGSVMINSLKSYDSRDRDEMVRKCATSCDTAR